LNIFYRVKNRICKMVPIAACFLFSAGTYPLPFRLLNRSSV
jgi:hypothetical protein